jgi:predicted dehydrogenase
MKMATDGSAVRIGAIGAGWWATTNHFPVLASRSDVELVAVCRPDAPLLEEVRNHFGFKFATEDYRELLALDLDAVLVSTPHHVHFEHARAALGAGCHVLCEKPMTLDAAQAWEMVEFADRNDLILLVPYGWHYKPFIGRVKELMDSGVIGPIEFVSCYMASPTKGFFAGDGGVPSTWSPTLAAPDMRTWQDPTRGGGYARGQLTHSTALALWLTGLRTIEVSAVSASMGAAVDLYNAAHVRFDNGAIGSVVGSATLPDDSKFQIDLRIFGAKGAVMLDVERERAEFVLHDGTTISIPVESGDGAYSCESPPDRFIDLIVGRTSANPSPGEVAARSVELVEAIHRSAASGGQLIRIGASSGREVVVDDPVNTNEPARVRKDMR